jgi:hypothetical protein
MRATLRNHSTLFVSRMLKNALSTGALKGRGFKPRRKSHQMNCGFSRRGTGSKVKTTFSTC